MNVLCLIFQTGLQLLPRCANGHVIPCVLGILQMSVGLCGKLCIDWQVHELVTLAGNPDCKFHTVETVWDGCHVGLVLLRREHLLQNRRKLHFSDNASGLDIGEYLAQVADALCHSTHLAEAF